MTKGLVSAALCATLAAGSLFCEAALGASESANIADPAVAATPPMGWNPWNAFRTDVDESRILETARLLKELGLAKIGYRYVNIDDGWAFRREADGRLRIRTSTFPSAELGNGQTSFRPYVEKLHAMGLKAGIYSDIGRNTCAQFWDANEPNQPVGSRLQREVGTYGFQKQDALLFFTEWGFDYIKLDACGVADYAASADLVKKGRFRAFMPLILRDRPAASDAAALEKLYADFSRAAQAATPSSRPILAICAWGEADVADWAGRYGNLWRTSPDIDKTWATMLRNFDSAAPRALFAGPGRWNDPDMLEIGNGDFDATHLTEARTHMSLWAIIAAPLILSYDLSRSTKELLDIVGNPDVIAIDQDPAGNQGVILSRDGDIQVLVKQLADGSQALAIVNRGETSRSYAVPLTDLHLDATAPVTAHDVWQHRSYAISGGQVQAQLGPHETLLLRLTGTLDNPDTVYLSQMPARVRVLASGFRPTDRGPERPWVPARLGYLPSGESAIRNGRPDRKALAVAAGARIEIALNGEFKRFHAVPDGAGPLQIFGDGRLLFRADGTERIIDVPVINVRRLQLVSPPANRSGSLPYGVRVWHEVSLIKQDADLASGRSRSAATRRP